MVFLTPRVSKPAGRQGLLLLLILGFLVLQHATAAGLIINRKVSVEKELGNVKEKKGDEGLLFVASELRAVPAGPDPLHHNGGGPNKKKPRTSTP